MFKDAFFWKAMMQKYNGDYKTASKSFKKVKSLYGRKKNDYYYLKAKKEIASCSFARRQQNDSIENCEVKNIGDQLNTTNSEFSAVKINNDLYFSSLRSNKVGEELEIFAPNEYKVAIYKAKQEGGWKTQNKLDSTINSMLSHSANGTYDSIHKIFYFTKCDSLSHCEIYSSKFDGQKWITPTRLPDKINQKATTSTQPNLAHLDGKDYLFFVSNRKGGIGNLDIYVCQVLDGNTFTKPTNLGKEINTMDADITPFYHSKSKTFYFSSSWHNGFGGFDVFKCVGTPENLSEPENMLPPINTQWNDFYYSIDNEELNGFLTSNRLGVFYKKGPTCCNDIWEVNFKEDPKPDELVIESLDDLNKYLPVTLYFHNDRPGPRSMDTTVADNYLTTYEKYKALQPTYRKEYSKGLSGVPEMDARLDIDDYFKHYVDKGVKDLELFTSLLLEELKKGQKIEITIKGFASPLAKTEYNVNLTKRRISSLINYLRAYGNGEFNAYIDKNADNGAELTFLKIPFGEYTANTNVSDDYYDQRNSIYNRKAAVERKIEIQSITFAKKDSIYAGLTVPNGTFDFGKVNKGDIVKHSFIIKNTGNNPLNILKVVSGCDCVSASYEATTIAPGATANITIEMNTKNLIGKHVKSITVIADSFPRTKRLVVTAEIMEK